VPICHYWASSFRLFAINTRVFWLLRSLSEIEPVVQEYKAALEKEGRMVYVYTVCEDVSGRLCPNEAVGAFMATAREIQVVMSGAARRSSFVMREITLSQQVRGRGGYGSNTDHLGKSCRACSGSCSDS
jgi:hypothetical protein